MSLSSETQLRGLAMCGRSCVAVSSVTRTSFDRKIVKLLFLPRYTGSLNHKVIGLTRGCSLQVGITPLHGAADQGRITVLQMLLEAGADNTATTPVMGGVEGSAIVGAHGSKGGVDAGVGC